MNYNQLCKAAASLHGNIEVAIVLSGGKLVASYLKEGGPMPDEDEFGKMISQLETVIRTIKSNEDKFGELGFITIHYRYIDGLLFPINDHDTLVVGMVQPYDCDKVVGKVSALIESRKRDVIENGPGRL